MPAEDIEASSSVAHARHRVSAQHSPARQEPCRPGIFAFSQSLKIQEGTQGNYVPDLDRCAEQSAARAVTSGSNGEPLSSLHQQHRAQPHLTNVRAQPSRLL
eukprot:CAMPEP_0206059764 /NCGR_PEP_ID=MMETSP1466-20131121/49750_1 /ASSEMBLY_ACC=CAM_ASM_001126 /TAXON_ID=44452 /ORGANISM="Pavlova gyrans, Strain CCMP608" /LENGTH=101 /DNA_ID=CAMNT_0053435087 /DNA_START=152 /DNA_END=454 /DNA_ORIENTATION=+